MAALRDLLETVRDSPPDAIARLLSAVALGLGLYCLWFHAGLAG